jgi:hypothetical protein
MVSGSKRKKKAACRFSYILHSRCSLEKRYPHGHGQAEYTNVHIYTDVDAIIVKKHSIYRRVPCKSRQRYMNAVASGSNSQTTLPAVQLVLGHCFVETQKRMANMDASRCYRRKAACLPQRKHTFVQSKRFPSRCSVIPIDGLVWNPSHVRASAYQPTPLPAQQRPRAPAFAPSIKSPASRWIRSVPATQASASWALQCGKNSGRWETCFFSSRVRRWDMRCHRNTRAVP